MLFFFFFALQNLDIHRFSFSSSNMNASASIRKAYVRQSMATMQPLGIQNITTIPQARPVDEEKLRNFKPVDYIEHRNQCRTEKLSPGPFYDLQGMEAAMFNTPSISEVRRARFQKMFTVIPYRDPIYLVAVIFLIGSLDLVINAFLDLVPHAPPPNALEAREVMPEPMMETEEPISVPITVLIGSIAFFVAGIFDTFSALNAEHGTFEMDGKGSDKAKFKPALLGTPEFKWIPDWAKFIELTATNIAFQAGLIVLFGGIIFMFAGIVDFPGVIQETSPFFNAVVFGPQIIHGLLFFVANAMLALSEQKRWWEPKLDDPDWTGAVLNTIGGLSFMLAGIFLLEKDQIAAAISELIGSMMFALGSLLRLYVVMEIY
ncbi:unnamed protein product [Periconia digitata]|uniref:Uncharacterized protein n=1 Tax=Periconia digitata TaxID=1303443 RepID=A0A9W4UCX5_9PLEO|nr:unnamed protein product [Periconia digitata]